MRYYICGSLIQDEGVQLCVWSFNKFPELMVPKSDVEDLHGPGKGGEDRRPGNFVVGGFFWFNHFFVLCAGNIIDMTRYLHIIVSMVQPRHPGLLS